MAYPVTINGRTYTLADFEGNKYVEGLPDAFEDFVTHAGSIYKTTSTTSNAIGTGSKTFTVEALKPYQVGTPLRITDTAAPSTNWIDAIVTSYSGTTLVVDAVAYAGSGTKTAWSINIGGGGTSYDGTLPIAQGGTGATTQAAARTNLGLGTGDSPEFAGADINGGTIDGTVIGGTTPAAITATTFTGTDLTLSGGVYLGGTGSANLLDDYEEGTWTPTLNAGFTASNINLASYTKIGRLVNIQVDMTVTGTGTTADLYMGGLPFTNASDGWSTGSGYFQLVNNNYYMHPTPLVRSGETNLVWQINVSTANGELMPANNIDAGYMQVSVTYQIP